MPSSPGTYSSLQLLSIRTISAIFSIFVVATAFFAGGNVPPAHAKSTNPIDVMIPGTWYGASNSQMNRVVYGNQPGDDKKLAAAIHAVEGPAAIMNDWSGAAFDTKRDNLFVSGGGHSGYAGNEVYVFNMDSLSWSRLTKPSQPTIGVAGVSFADGQPDSCHTYNGIVYMPDVDRVYGGWSACYPIGAGGSARWLFNFPTNSWSLISASSDPDQGAMGAIGINTAYDPVTGHVWIEQSGHLNEFDPTTGTYKYYSDGATPLLTSTGYNIYTTAAIDPTDRLMVATGAGGTYLWHLDRPGGWVKQATTGDDTPSTVQAPGFVWNPKIKMFVAWAGGSIIYTLDPKSWKWTSYTPAAGNTVTPTATNKSGTYGRFQYAPAHDVFVVVNATNQDVYVYKPDFGSSSSSLW